MSVSRVRPPPVTRQVVALTSQLLRALDPGPRTCVAWELDAVRAARVRAEGPAACLEAKTVWLADTTASWGPCGRAALVDGAPVAHLAYAPAGLLPGASAYATSPASPDAVVLAAFHVKHDLRGAGLGRVLVQAMAADLLQRGVHAIEAFGATPLTTGRCTVSADALRAMGFAVLRPHPRHPRLRLDLRSTVSWRGDVEGAIERVLGAIVRPAARPEPSRRQG